MTTVPKVYIGVDISKNSLDVCIFPSQQFFKFENTVEDIKKMLKILIQYEIGQIACEATGGYEKLLKTTLKAHDYDLWIVDPRRIRGFIIASGCRTKTDKIDAQKIAEFASKNSRNYSPIEKSENQVTLQSLVNRKNDLTKVLATEKTRLKHPSHALYLPSIQRLIKVLAAEIRAIDQQMRELIKSDDKLDKMTSILESIPGIGIASAALLISHIPELGKISNRKISALTGVCPYDNESGKYKGRKSIRGGRVVPRNNLYMCALTTIKYNLILKKFYDRLIANKKPFKVAIVAVMHKLIIIANSLLKKGELCVV